MHERERRDGTSAPPLSHPTAMRRKWSARSAQPARAYSLVLLVVLDLLVACAAALDSPGLDSPGLDSLVFAAAGLASSPAFAGASSLCPLATVAVPRLSVL